jgi:uncharacterized protein involved in response to NO
MASQPPSAFLSIGFRPFYLGAALFAAVSVALWIAAYLFAAPLPTAYPAYLWHMHEMLFGFGVAVMAGFLLTAVRNWTGRMTPSGAGLAGLFGLWVLGRLAPFTGSALLYALVDSAFLPCVAALLAVPIWRSGNVRNAFVIGILAALWICNLTFHVAVLGGIAAPHIQTSITVAADVVLLLMIIIGGRIIPAFSANAIPGPGPRTWRAVEVTSIGLVLVITLLDIANLVASDAMRSAQTLLLYAAAAVHLLRLIGWRPWRTRANVLLLVLPLSYLWIPVHLLLRAYLGGMPGVLTPVAAHALFVGAMAGLMLSMMTRSALGHTGRPLQAGPAEVACFLFVQLAAVLRVAGPWIVPDQAELPIALSAILWCAAFAIFVFAYVPILFRPRVEPGLAAPTRPVRLDR